MARCGVSVWVCGVIKCFGGLVENRWEKGKGEEEGGLRNYRKECE